MGGLDPDRSGRLGGYYRQPFTRADAEVRAWFVQQAEARGLALTTDSFGNLLAWWLPEGVEAAAARGVVTGSHLDSVRDGGGYDGPLGVVSALAALDRLRATGFVPQQPLGVAVFVEEEGSRFGVACLGSRLAVGSLSWERARELADPAGVRLAEAMSDAGFALPGDGPGWSVTDRIDCYLELHIEQGRDLVDREAAVGAGSEIWPHGRYRYEFCGEANHAGTTRMSDRRDPMLSYAVTALAANKQARLAGQRATFGRIEVVPGSTNAIASKVTAWLDVRADTEGAQGDLVESIEQHARERATRDGVTLMVTTESASGAVRFDPELTARIAAQPDGEDWPIIPTGAGHDAGVLSAAGISSAMLFVRNPTGVSHAPAEFAHPADCLAGIDALAESLRRVAE